MKRDIKIALNDMEDLLTLADWAEQSGEIQNRTVASLYIRAMIRGNDALCLTYLRERPGRHDTATTFFQRLYEENHIPDTLSRYRTTMSNVLQQKADMQYKSVELSTSDLNRLKKRVTRFIDNAVRKHT